jgi:group I intron endonuclease
MKIINGKVYKIINLINGKIYIGQTIRTIKERWRGHYSDAKIGKTTVIATAIREHGKENFTIEQIDSATTQKELNEKEAYWISEFKSLNYQNGYNVLPMDHRVPMSDFIKEMNHKAALEKYKEKFNVYKAVQKGEILKGELVGEWENQSVCAKDLNIISPSDISAVLRGTISQSDGYIFEYVDEELKKKAQEKLKNTKKARCKPFNVYKALKNKCSTKGEFVGTWISQKHCIRDLNLISNGIYYCLIGKIKQFKGYIFEYTDKTDTQPIEIVKYFNVYTSKRIGGNKHLPYKREKQQFVGKWCSVVKCKKDLNLGNTHGHIGQCLKGSLQSYKGYIFEYIE